MASGKNMENPSFQGKLSTLVTNTSLPPQKRSLLKLNSHKPEYDRTRDETINLEQDELAGITFYKI